MDSLCRSENVERELKKKGFLKQRMVCSFEIQKLPFKTVWIYFTFSAFFKMRCAAYVFVVWIYEGYAESNLSWAVNETAMGKHFMYKKYVRM
jgi:hypothetical protein